MSQYVAVVKIGYTPLVNDDEPCVPSNIAALTYGLMALLAADAQDFQREDSLWGKAKDALIQEQEDDQGGGVPPMQVADSFMMNELRCSSESY